MNIRYDSTFGFVAEFSTDFQGDLTSVKSAGFRTTGPPQWIWYTSKLPVLNKLRENKPVSGLTVTEGAYAQFTRLTEMDAVNAAARAQFAPIKEEQVKAKKQRKKEILEERTYTKVVIPEKGYLGREDFPPLPPLENAYIPPSPPSTTCFVCSNPTYFYELPDLCLWCEANA